MIDTRTFLAELDQAISSGKIRLPTLPEVALRVREAVESERSSAQQIAELVATDAALAARLLQVANSPLYRGRIPIESVQMAVTRLGVRLVRSLVTSLIMQQIFQASSDALDRKFHEVWQGSVAVAGLSRVLAQPFRGRIDRDEAMLAGLIHNIGALPILALADDKLGIDADTGTLNGLIEQLNPAVGGRILEEWGFPAELQAVPGHYRDFDYDGGPEPTVVDIVQVARLQTLIGSGHPDTALDWAQIPAFGKTGIDPEISVIEIEGVAEDLQEVEEIFLG